jgi:hypothetical protein
MNLMLQSFWKSDIRLDGTETYRNFWNQMMHYGLRSARYKGRSWGTETQGKYLQTWREAKPIHKRQTNLLMREARVLLKKKISGRESQGLWRQNELIVTYCLKAGI